MEEQSQGKETHLYHAILPDGTIIKSVYARHRAEARAKMRRKLMASRLQGDLYECWEKSGFAVQRDSTSDAIRQATLL